MHPNIPAKERTSLGDRIFSARLGLMGLMLVSPELVALLASNEWASASVLIKTLSRRSIFIIIRCFIILIQIREISRDSMDRDTRHDGGDGWF